ncbi:MAG: preprotein translocase subunit SecG [Sulfurovum sp.]|uniref:preprotein translocase subunit SecG n=1 Tax=Sulfurovum sp. TaxID=1969726 RepID=UPI003C70BFF5
MTSTLLIVQIVLALAITVAVLLQKSSSIGLGAYSGSNESVFGAKGPTGFLAKLTFTLAFAFIVNTLALGYLYTTANTASVADSIVPANNAAVPAAPITPASTTPTAPAAPTVTDNSVPTNNTVVPAAPTSEGTTPAAPAAPTAN